MSFFAGAIIAKAIMDTTQWVSGSKTMNSSMGTIGKGFNILKTIGVAAIGAVSAAFVKSVSDANEWQKEFANVTTLVDETKVNTQEMALELLKLDSRLGDTTDLTNGLYQALSASVDPAKAVQFVGEAAQFAKAALVDTNTAVDVITTGLNAYGFEADKATNISDQLFSVIKLGKTTGEELSSVIGQSIPLAANMGIGFDELGASIAIMTRQGINAANATTQFNAVINAFLKPSDAMLATLDELGYSSGSAAIEALGFKGALDAVTASTGGSKDELAGLFANTRALRGVLALTGEGASDFDEVLNEITNSAGATRTAFEKQEITFETFKSTTGKLSIIIGNIGKTFVDELAVGATQAANSMIDFLLSAQGAEVISNIIGFLAGSFEAVKTAIQPISEVLGPSLNKVFLALQEAGKEVTGTTDEGTSAFMVFGKTVSLVAATVEILADALKLVIRFGGNLFSVIKDLVDVNIKFYSALADPFNLDKWDQVGESVTNVGGDILELFTELGEDTGNLFATIGDKVSNFNNEAKKAAEDIEISYTTTFNRVQQNSFEMYDSLIIGQANLTDLIKRSNEEILDSFKSTNEEIENIFTTTGNRIADIYNTANNQIETDTKQTKASLFEAWTEYWEGVKERAIDATQTINNILEETMSSLGSAFETTFMALGELWAGGEDAAESFWDTIKQAAKDTIVTILKALAQEFAIRALAALASLRFAAAAGWGAASAAALVAAGAVSALATGGVANGLTLVGEQGPELIDVGTPSRVYPADETRNMLNGRGTTMNNTFNIYNQNDTDYMMEKLGTRFNQKRKSL